MIKVAAVCFVFVCVCCSLFAEDLKTVNGKEYKNVTVTRVEPDGIVLRTKSGIAKVYFVELPEEIQKRFNYDSASASAYQAAEQEAFSKQQRSQANAKTGVIYPNRSTSDPKIEAIDQKLRHNQEAINQELTSLQIIATASGVDSENYEQHEEILGHLREAQRELLQDRRELVQAHFGHGQESLGSSKPEEKSISGKYCRETDSMVKPQGNRVNVVGPNGSENINHVTWCYEFSKDGTFVLSLSRQSNNAALAGTSDWKGTYKIAGDRVYTIVNGEHALDATFVLTRNGDLSTGIADMQFKKRE